MPLRVLIVPDKFKGTLSAEAAAEAIAQGWRTVRPKDTLVLLPMSDGGDGFGAVMGRLLDAEARTTATINAAHEPRDANWWWDPKSRTAIVESAQVIGLAWLPPGKHHPFGLDTFGLGALVDAARTVGARQLLVGLGGSATNDGGFGLARALGWKFCDAGGRQIERWTGLISLAQIVAPASPRCRVNFVVAVDVQNPLLGPSGASRVYGPQKGLREADFPLAEACLARLAEVVGRDLGLEAASEPGAGAAGGLGYGLRVFCGARLAPGFGLFARQARLAERIRAADLVVTGEGTMDASTLMGKGVGEVARLSKEQGIPCVGLAGIVTESAATGCGDLFARVAGMAPLLTTPEAAKANAAWWLARLAAGVAESWRT